MSTALLTVSPACLAVMDGYSFSTSIEYATLSPVLIGVVVLSLLFDSHGLLSLVLVVTLSRMSHDFLSLDPEREVS